MRGSSVNKVSDSSRPDSGGSHLPIDQAYHVPFESEPYLQKHLGIDKFIPDSQGALYLVSSEMRLQIHEDGIQDHDDYQHQRPLD